VVATTGNAHLVVDDLVHQAMLVGDASGPVARQPMLEGLGLADSLIAVTCYVLDEQVDALERPAVFGLPPPLVVPSSLIPDEEHRLSPR